MNTLEEEWEHCPVFMDKDGSYPLKQTDRPHAKGCWCNNPNCAKFPYERVNERRWPAYLALAVFIAGFWFGIGMAVLFAFG